VDKCVDCRNSPGGGGTGSWAVVVRGRGCSAEGAKLVKVREVPLSMYFRHCCCCCCWRRLWDFSRLRRVVYDHSK
jgi:hypothetical protein